MYALSLQVQNELAVALARKARKASKCVTVLCVCATVRFLLVSANKIFVLVVA